MRRHFSMPFLFVTLLFVCPGPDAAGQECVSATPVNGSPVAAESNRVTVGERDGLLWGSGATGVVLVHGAIYDAASWTEQAEVIAESGVVVLAVEQISKADVLAGIDLLVEDHCVERVVVVGASAGVSGSLAAAAARPGSVAGVIVLAGSGNVDELGPYPKLFIASEGEGLATTMATLAEVAPGNQNQVVLLPGSAHAQAVFSSDQGTELLTTMIEFISDIDAKGESVDARED